MMYCTPETYIILLTNVTPINSIKKEGKKKRKGNTTGMENRLVVASIRKGGDCKGAVQENH